MYKDCTIIPVAGCDILSSPSVEASPASPCEGSVTTMSSTPPTPSALQNVRILEICTDDGHGHWCLLFKDSIVMHFPYCFCHCHHSTWNTLVSWATLQAKLFSAGDQLQANCNQKGLEVEREEFFSHHVAVCLPNNFWWLCYGILHSCISFQYGMAWYIIHTYCEILLWTFSAKENWLCKFHQILVCPWRGLRQWHRWWTLCRFTFQLLEELSRFWTLYLQTFFNMAQGFKFFSLSKNATYSIPHVEN